ncbi:YbgC/FadM family acyl-CoA thioesterase [Pseudorhodoferax sp. Leaf267]|uniref:YbgC/FadM family acyl-CoA thioesterase n=1 Tax=Pseudorhodoferax sp. Leaf267 TaxID=1736316 RepID=UPI0006F2E645|nr:YbgC/FadM family acyl-CoA thioesterase [Pseudorhodoferax sp. Leaf267]KQP14888.1 4-hydroxybenzoyl-CoA thioesterase [Pseudorhodoferax sp. Leaf267]
MKRQDFRFFHRLRVRWAEVDMQKIVFNAHYLAYFDVAVSDYWRALALPYEESFALLGGELFVKKATVEYHGSARNDDQLDVALKCEHLGRSSMRFAGAIFRGDTLLITGELVYVFADPVQQTSKPIPDALRTLLQDFEAGGSATRMQLGAWSALQAAASQVRTEVFVQEQGIAREDEWDEADATAVHAVLFNRLDQPIATGRLLQHAPGVAKIGRMAVRRAVRGSQHGGQILQALVQAAAARGDGEVLLHAQRSAEGFYRRMGFAVRGEPFDEVGIAHVEMVLPLQMSSSKG